MSVVVVGVVEVGGTVYRVTSGRSPKEGKKKVGSKEGKGTTSAPQRTLLQLFGRLHFLLLFSQNPAKEGK